MFALGGEVDHLSSMLTEIQQFRRKVGPLSLQTWIRGGLQLLLLILLKMLPRLRPVGTDHYPKAHHQLHSSHILKLKYIQEFLDHDEQPPKETVITTHASGRKLSPRRNKENHSLRNVNKLQSRKPAAATERKVFAGNAGRRRKDMKLSQLYDFGNKNCGHRSKDMGKSFSSFKIQ